MHKAHVIYAPGLVGSVITAIERLRDDLGNLLAVLRGSGIVVGRLGRGRVGRRGRGSVGRRGRGRVGGPVRRGRGGGSGQDDGKHKLESSNNAISLIILLSLTNSVS